MRRLGAADHSNVTTRGLDGRTAARPSRCTEDGLPVISRARTRASRTAGKSGAVAFQSIYVRVKTVIAEKLRSIFHAPKRIFLEITVALAL